MQKRLSLIILILFFGCQQKINLSKFEGYYEYLHIDPINHSIIDSVRTKAIFTNFASDGLRVIDIDILDHTLLTDTALLRLWNVEEINNQFLVEYIPYFKMNIQKGDTWEKCIGNRFRMKFICLSTDTTINLLPAIKFDNITLIREKRWMDYWDIREFGYDKNIKIIYYTHYMKYNIGNNSKRDIFILNKFIPKNKIDSTFANKWLQEKPIHAEYWVGKIFDPL